MSYRVAVRVPGRDVEAWSSVRLPFEPKGWQVDFRRDLAQACRAIAAEPGQVLHAVYTSADPRLADLENVLTYNLGTGAVSAAARHGMVLERVFEPVLGDEHHDHHYRYHLASAEQRWTHWTAGPSLGSLQLCAPAEVFSSPNAGRWWRHARRGQLTAHQRGDTIPHRFVLCILICPPPGWRGGLAGLVKPLTDGVVSAMHAHEGSADAVAARAASVDPTLTPTEFRRLLLEPRQAPLGRIRLVVPRGATLQWLPADDRIVAMDIRRSTDEEPGTVTAEAMSAHPST